MPVTIKISDSAAKHFGDSPKSIARALLERAALEDYRSERISLGKLSEILGQDRWQTEEFLDQHNAQLPYTLEMLEQDRKSIKKILGVA